jgi:hypothetical protein
MVNEELDDKIKAITPAAFGQALEVPLKVAV